METMQRSPERLAVLSQFYLCWCFIARYRCLLRHRDGWPADGLRVVILVGVRADSYLGYSGLLADYHLDRWPAFISV